VDFVSSGLPIDLFQQRRQIAFGHFVGPVSAPQCIENRNHVETPRGRQLHGGAVSVERRGHRLDLDAFADLLQDAARRLQRLESQDAFGPGDGHSRGTLERKRRGAVRHLPCHRANVLAHENRRYVDLSDHQRGAPLLLSGAIEIGELLAVCFLELSVENPMVLAGQVDSGARRIARYLSQAARRRLKDEVVRTAKPARKGAGEQARTVPSLSALVHEQDHAMRRSRVVQSVERFDIVGLGEARIRRVDERQSRG